MTAIIISAAELASELGTDGRTTRKFLRSITPRDAQPGKGSRWGIAGNKKEIASLRKKFAEFNDAQEIARAARELKKAQATAEVKEIDEVIEMDEMNDDALDALADELFA